MKKAITLSLLAALTATSIGAFALNASAHDRKGSMMRGGAEKIFTMMDTDNSDTITIDEAQAQLQEHFALMDADKDQTLSKQEIRDYFKAMRTERKRKKGGGWFNWNNHDDRDDRDDHDDNSSSNG